MLTVEGSYENISKIIWFVLLLHIKLQIKIDSIYTYFLVCMSVIIFKKVLLTFRYWSLIRNTGWSKEELKFVRKGHQEKETKADKHQTITHKIVLSVCRHLFLGLTLWCNSNDKLCYIGESGYYGLVFLNGSSKKHGSSVFIWYLLASEENRILGRNKSVHQGITQLNILTLQVEGVLDICAQNPFLVLPIFLTLG